MEYYPLIVTYLANRLNVLDRPDLLIRVLDRDHYRLGVDRGLELLKVHKPLRVDPESFRARRGLREPFLRGSAIRFGFVDPAGAWLELTGSVDGQRMGGTFQAGGKTGRWTAVRL